MVRIDGMPHEELLLNRLADTRFLGFVRVESHQHSSMLVPDRFLAQSSRRVQSSWEFINAGLPRVTAGLCWLIGKFQATT